MSDIQSAIKRIDEHGWAIVDNAVSDETLAAYRVAIDRLYCEDRGVREHQKSNPDTYYVELLPNKDPLFEIIF